MLADFRILSRNGICGFKLDEDYSLPSLRRRVGMYIEHVDLTSASIMPIQIANPSVVEKVERLAKATGLSKTAAVERAVDRLLREIDRPERPSERVKALLAQIDRIADRANASDPLQWDANGLPR